MIQKFFLVATLIGAVGVAGTTVTHQVQGRLRCYGMARLDRASSELDAAVAVVRVRVARLFAPEQVAARAARRRAERDALANPAVTPRL